MSGDIFDYKDFVPNPHVAFFWLQIGGEEVTIEGGKPTSWVSMIHERNIEDQMNRLTVRLFDPESDKIEQLLLDHSEGHGTPINFKYGYTTGRMSPVFTGFITNYAQRFVVGGTELVLTGFSSIAGTDFMELSRSEDYVDDKQQGKRIDEIVTLIAEKHGYKPDVEETEPVYDNSHTDLAQPMQMKFIQGRLTDTQFIVQSLIPYAKKKGVVDKKGAAQYRLWFTDTESGEESKTLHFRPMDLDAEPFRSYTFMHDKDSPVISFTPTTETFVAAIAGALKTVTPYIDNQTGTVGVVIHEDSTTEGKDLLGGNYVPSVATSVTPKPEDGGKTFSHEAPRDADQADTHSRNYYADASMYVYTAELVIQGDPEIVPNKIIEVLLFTTKGKKHWTSGRYLSIQCIDAIQGGLFTTTMRLNRNAAPDGSQTGHGDANPPSGDEGR